MEKHELVFDVELDEDGNYCARADVSDGSLLTDARSLDDLMTAILDLLELYREDTGEPVPTFALRFTPPNPLAA
jgi:hypothetical protein